MVIRIHDTARWSRAEAGKRLVLPGDKGRKIRLEVNCPLPTRFDLFEGDKLTFLAVVQGLEIIEFYTPGDCELIADTEDDWFYATSEGDVVDVFNPEATSFVRLAQRKTRNPALEMMQFKMEQNMERRLARQKLEIEQLYAAREARLAKAAEAGANTETGELDEPTDDLSAVGGTGEAGAQAGTAPASGKAASGTAPDAGT